MAHRSNKLLVLTTLVAFAAGVAAGYVVKGFVAPLPPHSYRTRVRLPLTDADGHAVGELPAGSLIVSKYSLGKSENGWVGLVPLLLGDGSDATELLTGQMKTPSLISVTDMLFVQRAAVRQRSAPVPTTKEPSTVPRSSVTKH
jgi:hypothetical protein